MAFQMPQIPGIGIYDGTTRPQLIVQNGDTYREWHIHATNEVIAEVCENFDLDYEALWTTIRNVSKDTHTVLIDVVPYKEYQASLKE
jgi:hypothetical protein